MLVLPVLSRSRLLPHEMPTLQPNSDELAVMICECFCVVEIRSGWVAMDDDVSPPAVKRRARCVHRAPATTATSTEIKRLPSLNEGSPGHR